MLRNEQPLSCVLTQFLQWVTMVTAEVSDSTSTTHFPGIAINFYSKFYLLFFYMNIVLVAHSGFSYDFPILFSEVEKREVPLSTFETNNIHFSDPLPLLRMVIKIYPHYYIYMHLYAKVLYLPVWPDIISTTNIDVIVTNQY